jgi:rhamnosyltransferase
MRARRDEVSVFVVLSTFNGARHLRAQLESIQRQELRDWVLLVRDDGSTDETMALLQEFARQDGRIRILDSRGANRGAIASFGLLLEAAYEQGADYVFLADQDDVWLPDKLTRQLARVQECERGVAAGTPVLVHSDLTVVDSQLQLVHPSFLEYQNLRHEPREAVHVLLVQNFVTGCASVVNRALLEVALPFPPVLGMHDWWLAQCAATCGVLEFLPTPLVLYRQHGANVVGARGFSRLVRRALLHPWRWWANSWRVFRTGNRQLAYLAQRVQRPEVAAARRPALVAGYSAAIHHEKRALPRLRTVVRLGVHPQTAVRRPFFYLRVLLARDPAARSGVLLQNESEASREGILSHQ